jgi:hypothetical protein
VRSPWPGSLNMSLTGATVNRRSASAAMVSYTYSAQVNCSTGTPRGQKIGDRLASLISLANYVKIPRPISASTEV